MRRSALLGHREFSNREHESAIEKVLSDASIVAYEPLGCRARRVSVQAAPPIRFMWKRTSGNERYEAEIAAYKLDRTLGLNMVPTTVERNINGENGSACLWVENASHSNYEHDPDSMSSEELTRMKMFDLLIANTDRHQNNVIYDRDFHVFLIDHGHAFRNQNYLVGKDSRRDVALRRVDRELWKKMAALTPCDLKSALGELIGPDEKTALLRRRDLMGELIETNNLTGIADET